MELPTVVNSHRLTQDYQRLEGEDNGELLFKGAERMFEMIKSSTSG